MNLFKQQKKQSKIFSWLCLPSWQKGVTERRVENGLAWAMQAKVKVVGKYCI